METSIAGVTHVTAAVAAEELQTTQLKVLMLLKQKALTGSMVDGEWFVSRESLDCAKVHGIDRSVQSQCKTSCSTGSCGCAGR
jgi:hypothetical protein